jgi:hypothetical protein
VTLRLLLPLKLRGCSIGVIDQRDLLSTHDILPSFVKDSIGVEVVLRLFFSNVNGCNVGITVGIDV